MSFLSGLRRVFSFSGSRFTASSLPACSLLPSLWPHLSAVSTHVVPHHPNSRCVHTSIGILGLEEFFPKGGNLVEDAEKTGRSWEARELRHKSNGDLHKLWYVLLKERNMLLTLKHEANRQGYIMPAPERLKKVRRSMARIKVVIGERERAISKAKEQLNLEQTANQGEEAERDKEDQPLEEKAENIRNRPSETT